MVRNWPRNEDNDPLTHDTKLLEVLIKEKGGYPNFEVGNLEFASPTLEEALEKVKPRGATNVLFIGGTGFLDRSSHSLVDIPKAIEKLQNKYPDVKMFYDEPNLDLICPELALLMISKVKKALKIGNRSQMAVKNPLKGY